MYCPLSGGFLTAYTLLGVGTKFSFRHLTPLVFNVIFFRPLWYFKLLIFMTDTLVALLGLEVFSRKSKRLWARVGVAFICEV